MVQYYAIADAGANRDLTVRYPVEWDTSFGPCPWPSDAPASDVPAIYLRPFVWTGKFKAEFWTGRLDEWANVKLPALVDHWEICLTPEDAKNGNAIPLSWEGWLSMSPPWRKAIMFTLTQADRNDFLAPERPSGNGEPGVTSIATLRQKRQGGRLPRSQRHSDKNHGTSPITKVPSGETEDSSPPVPTGNEEPASE